MNKKNALDYLKNLRKEGLSEENKFVADFERQINIQSGPNHNRTSSHLQQLFEIKTKLYQLFTQSPQDLEFSVFLLQFNNILTMNPTLLLQLCKNNSSLEIDIISLFSNKLEKALSVPQKICPQIVLQIISSLDKKINILNQKLLYHLYLALVLFWVCLLSEMELGEVLKNLPAIFQKIAIIQEKFTKHSNEFQIITYLFRVSSLALGLEDSAVQKNTPLSEIMAKEDVEEENTSEKQKGLFSEVYTQQISQSKALYYKTMERYTLLDPDFRINLIRHIKQLALQKLSQKIIEEHIEVVFSILNKRIFPDYSIQILKEISCCIGHLAEANTDNLILKTIQKLIIGVCENSPNPKQFLMSNKRILFCMGVNGELRKTIFTIYYNFIKSEKQKDREILDFLILLNIKLNLVSDEFVEIIRDIGFDVICQSTFDAISNCNSYFARAILKSKLETFDKGELKHQALFTTEYLKKNQKSYIFCSQVLLKSISNLPENLQIKDLKKISISDNTQKIKIIRGQAIFLIKSAAKNQIKAFQFVEKIYLICSILENQRILGIEDTQIEEYFISSFQNFNREDLVSMMRSLHRVYYVTATKISLFGLLCCLAYFRKQHNNNPEESEQYTYSTLKQLFNDHELTAQHKLIGFSEQSLKILVLISQYWIKNEKISEICVNLMSSWSSLFSKATVEILLFQFDSKIFQPYLKCMKIQLPVLSIERKFVISNSLKLIQGILEAPYCSLMTYISPYNNQIQLMPIQTASESNSLELKFKVSINPKKSFNSCIDFYSSSRDEGKSASMLIKHRISFTDKRFLFELRNTKQVIFCSDRLPVSRMIAVRVKIAQKKFKIDIDNVPSCSLPYNNLVENIKFEINGDIFIKDIEWKRFQNQPRYLDPYCHYCIFPGQLEIRMTKTSAIQVEQFSKLIPRHFLIAYLSQIFDNNVLQISIGEFYNLCFILILHSENSEQLFTKGQSESDYRKIVYFFFKSLRSQIMGRKTYSPFFQKIPAKIKSRQIYFDCLIGAYYNLEYLSLCSSKLKKQIVQYITAVIIKDEDFVRNFQNQNLIFFSNSFEICESLGESCEELLATKILPAIRYVIMTHKPNKLLLEKMKHFFFSCKSSEIEIMKEFFSEVMGSFLEQITAKNKDKKSVEYVIMNLEEFDILFEGLCLQSKYTLLDYFLAHEQYFQKITSIVELISDQEYLQLENWMICNSKRILFEYFEYKKKDGKKLKILLFLIHCVIKLLIKKEENIEEEIRIISQFMSLSSKETENKGGIISEFCASDSFIYLLIFSIEKLDNSQENSDKRGKLLQEMVNACFDFIFACPKEHLLKFLTTFRARAAPKPQIFKYLFKLERILTLPVYSLSVFLQFTLEVIMLIRHHLADDCSIVEQLCSEIQIYIECLIKNYSLINKQIQNPLLYCYPRLQKTQNYEDTQNVRKTVEEITKTQVRQLNGGIYFKMTSIIIQLMEMFPEKNFSNNLEFIFQKICLNRDSTKGSAVLRAISDFAVVSREIKERNFIQAAIKNLATEHIQYYCKNDSQVIEKKPLPSLTQRKSNSQVDLTPYFLQFCLARLCYFLEVMGDQQEEPFGTIMKNYTNIFLKYVHESEVIFEEINSNNVEYKIEYEDVEQLLKMMKVHEMSTVSDLMNSPMSRKYSNLREQEQPSWDNNGFGGMLTPPALKRKRTFSIDLGSGKKLRATIFAQIQKSLQNWGGEPRKKKFHRFFANETKIIWLQELFHNFFTIVSADQHMKGFECDKKKVMKFFQDYTNQALDLSSNQCKKCKQIIKRIEIRKVYPFTISELPVRKIESLCFDNMTNPLIKQSEIGNYGNRHSQVIPNNRDSFMEFQTPNDIMKSLFSQSSEMEEVPIIKYGIGKQQVCLAFEDQKMNFQNICEISFREGVYFCQYQFQNDRIIFISKQQKYPPNEKYQRIIKFGTPLSGILPISGKKIEMKMDQIYKIFYRKYNQIKNSALEVFFKNGDSYMIILYTEKLAAGFVKKCQEKFQKFLRIKIVKDFVKDFNERGYTERWCNGQISNFDYLMLINKYSGRSLIDLNQYYIFPWVIKDFTSQQLNIDNCQIYRDLKKPIGALNQAKLRKYRQKLKSQSTEGYSKYLYGSHYSTSLFVLHYLVRIQPFTTLHCEMQSGQFDSPDRIFSSLAQMWQCLMCETSITDIKESIPEFYYLPQFLQNANKLDMGYRHNGAKVGDVELPPWASSPSNFISKMRTCLESDYVSMNLNYWIDLIFGKDQHSFDKDNVFHPLAYCDNIKPDSISTNSLDGIMTQIFYFGQNPYVLFPKEHPRKKMKMNLELFKSSNIKAAKTQRMEEKIEKKFYIGKVLPKKRGISLSIFQINRPVEIYRIDLNLDASKPALIKSLKQRKNSKLAKLHSLQGIQLNTQNYRSLSLTSNKSEVRVCMKSATDETLMKRLRLLYNFSNVIGNQSVLILYGSFGLRIYSWSLDLNKQIIPQKGQIVDVYLESTYFFYITSAGFLYIYDMSTQRSQQLCFIGTKPTKKAEMYVFPDIKQPTKKNQFSYKFVLLGDLRTIVIFMYTHTLMKK